MGVSLMAGEKSVLRQKPKEATGSQLCGHLSWRWTALLRWWDSRPRRAVLPLGICKGTLRQGERCLHVSRRRQDSERKPRAASNQCDWSQVHCLLWSSQLHPCSVRGYSDLGVFSESGRDFHIAQILDTYHGCVSTHRLTTCWSIHFARACICDNCIHTESSCWVKDQQAERVTPWHAFPAPAEHHLHLRY